MTVEPIVFPDSTLVAVTHLRTELAPTPVHASIPMTRPAAFVHVRRLGGVRRNLVVDEALLAVEAWAGTAEAAHDLAQAARAHLHAMVGVTVGSVPVYRVDEAAGPQYLPDPASLQDRYTFTVTVAVRGDATT
jgi:hypothetical protein